MTHDPSLSTVFKKALTLCALAIATTPAFSQTRIPPSRAGTETGQTGERLPSVGACITAVEEIERNYAGNIRQIDLLLAEFCQPEPEKPWSAHPAYRYDVLSLKMDVAQELGFIIFRRPDDMTSGEARMRATALQKLAAHLSALECTWEEAHQNFTQLYEFRQQPGKDANTLVIK